jgi:cob(I)alamin adenosyltransferase
MEKKYVANKGVIVRGDGRFLMVRDTGKGDHQNYKGKLGFPGGRMDHNETPHEALVRELIEEIGLTHEQIEIGRPFYVRRWGVDGDEVNEPVIGIFHLCYVKGEPEIHLSDEHSEAVWIDPKQPLPEELQTDSMKALLKAFQDQTGLVETADASIKGRMGYGLIQLFTGHGKGKTTASLGEVIRALGAGKRVGIVCFDKGGNTHYSERIILDQLKGVTYVATGRDRIDPVTGRFDFSIQEIDKVEAKRGLKEVEKMFIEQYDLVVMDEINSTTNLGMLSEQDVLTLLENQPNETELILTGRDAPESFLKRAHLVTEMKLRKHYFYSGVQAREGIDY